MLGNLISCFAMSETFTIAYLPQLEWNLHTKYTICRIIRKLKLRSGILVQTVLLNFIAGSEKYRSITTGHYRYALGAVLVYDVTNAESFKSCKYWVDNIR